MNKLLRNSEYLIALLVFVVLKIIFKYANTEQLEFLLKPTNKIVEIITNSNSEYVFKKGFYHESLNIIIDKSCSGFNFWLISFLMLSFLLLQNFINKKMRLIVLPLALSLAYFITILVNSSRILIAVFAQNTFIKMHADYSWLHQAEGSFVYLFSLVLVYLTTELLLKKISKYYA